MSDKRCDRIFYSFMAEDDDGPFIVHEMIDVRKFDRIRKRPIPRSNSDLFSVYEYHAESLCKKCGVRFVCLIDAPMVDEFPFVKPNYKNRRFYK